MPRSIPVALILVLLGACAAPDPPVTPPLSQAKLEPAPTPSAHYNARGVPTRFVDLPPRMPLGTGAIPTNGSPFRGSVTTGIKQSF